MRQYLNPPNMYQPEIYSQVVRVGNTILVSGQCAHSAETRFVGVGDPYAQARQCYQNVRLALESVGATMKDVVKINTYSTLDEYRKILIDIRKEFFEPPYPASTGVVVSALARPEWLFEVEAMAIIGE